MNEFWLCFVPCFVAIDAVGILPVFVSLTEGLEPRALRRIVVHSIVTAASVALVFLAFGPTLLAFLGITPPDFMIAGGVLLLAISLGDLLSGGAKQKDAGSDSLGVVPIGVPLIAGPALLTTCMLLSSTHGRPITAAALVLNLALAGVILGTARPINRLLGPMGIKAISKIASLFLAAIAVMLIRRGIFDALAAAGR